MDPLEIAPPVATDTPATRRLRLSFAGLIEATAFAALVATFLGRLGQFDWRFELAAHFPAQYAVCLAIGSAVALARRRWRSAAILLIGVGVNLFVLWQHGAVRQVPDGVAGAGLRILSLNVLSSNRHYDAALRVIREEHPDLIVVMELTGAWARGLEPLTGDYPHRVIVAREDNFGIACYSRRPLLRQEVITVGPAGLPSIEVEVELDGRRVDVIATHPLPPVSGRRAAARDGQLLALGARFRAREHPALIVGDLNTTPWAPGFQRLLAESGLRDTLAGRGWQPTWPAPLGRAGIPIDHCLVTAGWTVSERRPCRSICGDHHPLLIELHLAADPGAGPAG